MFNKPSMSEIDFWVILIQFKRTEQDFKKSHYCSILSHSVKKSSSCKKLIWVEQSGCQSTVVKDISHSFSLNTNMNGVFLCMNENRWYLEYMNEIVMFTFFDLMRSDWEWEWVGKYNSRLLITDITCSHLPLMNVRDCDFLKLHPIPFISSWMSISLMIATNQPHDRRMRIE